MTIKQMLSRIKESMVKWYFSPLRGYHFWDPRSGILGGIITGTILWVVIVMII